MVGVGYGSAEDFDSDSADVQQAQACTPVAEGTSVHRGDVVEEVSKDCDSGEREEEAERNGGEASDHEALPRRPGKPPCTFYLRTGICKYGASCKFDHPELQSVSVGRQGYNTYPYYVDGSMGSYQTTYGPLAYPYGAPTACPATEDVTAGMPDEDEERLLPEKMEGSVVTGLSAGMPTTPRSTQDYSLSAQAMAYQYGGMLQVPYAAVYPYIYTQPVGIVSQTYHLSETSSYPVRAGEPNCPYYMKTGHCKFGATCKFSHPPERLTQLSSTPEGGLSFNSLGLPIRANTAECSYYMRTRTCKFGRTCKFHHPELMPLISMVVPAGHGVPLYSQDPVYGQLVEGTAQPLSPKHREVALLHGNTLSVPEGGRAI